MANWIETYLVVSGERKDVSRLLLCEFNVQRGGVALGQEIILEEEGLSLRIHDLHSESLDPWLASKGIALSHLHGRRWEQENAEGIDTGQDLATGYTGKPDWVEMLLTFETPWDPPLEFVDRLARRFPQLEFDFEYADPYEGTCGRYRWESGICIWRQPGQMESYNAWINRRGGDLPLKGTYGFLVP